MVTRESLESSPGPLQSFSIRSFGPFRLELAERRLLRDGIPVPLTPKAFDVLGMLVEHAGHLVKKEDLLARIWPDAAVEEANLARYVWTLRKALGDNNEKPAYIETIPTVGYRFIAQVDAPFPPAPVPAAQVPAALVPAATHPQVSEPFSPPVVVAPPPASSGVGVPVLVAGSLALAVLVVSGVTWLRRSPPPAKTDAQPELTFLTDGRTDDQMPYWAPNGDVRFYRYLAIDRYESWLMNADGTNQRRANTEIKSLRAGRPSPDGRKMMFFKEGASRFAFVADADGANEMTLTMAAGNADWAPDSTRFVYQRTDSNIGLFDVTTGRSVNLTNSGTDADPAFSYDGRMVAFTSWRDGNAEIYVMHADGSGVRRLTHHPAFDSYPAFSPDGTQVAFQSNRENEATEVYLQDLNSDRPARRLTTVGTSTGLVPKAWSPDGTRLLVYTTHNGKHRIAITTVDPFPARLVLDDPGADLIRPLWSADGRLVLYEAQVSDGELELRITQVDNRRTRRLFTTVPDYPGSRGLTPAWSPDNALIAFSAKVGGNTEILTMKADGSGLQNVTQHPLLDSAPAFSADGREILFVRNAYGSTQLYRMDLTGTHQRRVTDAPGYEMMPTVSPDGRHLAFAGDRASNGIDIFLLDPTNPRQDTLLVARRFSDITPAFSPDGKRVVFIAQSDGNAEIYVMNVDGTGLLRLTHSLAEEREPQFSPDGHRIIFSSNRTGRFALYQLNLN